MKKLNKNDKKVEMNKENSAKRYEKREKVILAALWCALGLWALTGFFLSSQNGMDTARTSAWLTRLLAGWIGYTRAAALATPLRRAAHFVVFFGLGVLLGLAARRTFSKRRTRLLAYGMLAICAFLDEFKKLAIEGRHFSLAEVGLNLVGAAAGLLMIYATGIFLRKIAGNRA